MSAKPKLTPWFPGHIKQVRPGLYQQMAEDELGYQYWTGAQWGPWSSDAAEAFQDRKFPCWHQSDPWRGLASDPEAA